MGRFSSQGSFWGNYLTSERRGIACSESDDVREEGVCGAHLRNTEGLKRDIDRYLIEIVRIIGRIYCFKIRLTEEEKPSLPGVLCRGGGWDSGRWGAAPGGALRRGGGCEGSDGAWIGFW